MSRLSPIYTCRLRLGHIRLLRIAQDDEASDLKAYLEVYELQPEDQVQDDVTQSNQPLPSHANGTDESQTNEGQAPQINVVNADSSKSNTPPESVAQGPVPPYKALSYYWGSDEETQKLLVLNLQTRAGGADEIKYIKPNLRDALKRLRKDLSAGKDELFWIDAICINQEDELEKNVQIRQMAHIYSQAVEVCVWLGNEEDESCKAIEFAQTLPGIHQFEKQLNPEEKELVHRLQAFLKIINRPWFRRRWVVQEICLARKATVYCGDKDIPWTTFEEAVSLYEFYYPKIRVLLKSSRIAGNLIDAAGEIKESGAVKLAEKAHALIHKAKDGSIMDRRFSLQGLMTSLTMFETSNPYDILYSLLWLAYDAQPESALNNQWVLLTPRGSPVTTPTMDIHAAGTQLPLRSSHLAPPPLSQAKELVEKATTEPGEQQDMISVKYDLELFEVYKDFFAQVFKQSKSLDILCYAWAQSPKVPKPRLKRTRDGRPKSAGGPERQERDLPSWILLLQDHKTFDNDVNGVTQRIGADPLVGQPGNAPRMYSACGKTRAEFGKHVDIDDRSLFVCGFILGKVTSLNSGSDFGILPERWLKAVSWPERGSGGPNWFWRFLVAERGLDGRSEPPARWRKACQLLLDRRTPRQGIDMRATHVDHSSDTYDEFRARVRSVISKRGLFVLEPNRREHCSSGADEKIFGLVPEEAAEGDVVCILFGCSVPVVLRKTNKPSTTTRKVPVRHPDTFSHATKGIMHTSQSTVPAHESGHAQDYPTPGAFTAPSNTSQVHTAASSSPSALQLLTGDLDAATVEPPVNKYTFVGECYVYGMMSGEAFQMQTDNKVDFQWFELI